MFGNIVFIQMAGHAAALKPLEILYRLGIEGFTFGHEAVRRRKILQRFGPGGNRVSRDIQSRNDSLPFALFDLFRIERLQIHIPGGTVAAGIPEDAGIVAVGLGIAIIQHRVERHLIGNGDFFPIPCIKTQCTGKTAAGTFPAHHKLRTADIQCPGILLHI